jgi:hypothetical protein
MRWAVAGGLAAGLSLAALALRPPGPAPSDAPDRSFSAARALPDVERLAAAPRTPGSRHHAAAREHLLARLSALGLEPEVQRAEAYGTPLANVFARRPGTGGLSGAVLLCAHYDTVELSPGAADDAMGCAVILEMLRALRVDPPPLRDLAVLLSDGEERRSQGARAFLREHSARDEFALVLNFDARGSGGPAYMFECSRGSAGLIAALARSRAPAASSLAAAVYEFMPNYSDLTLFLEAGVPGMNWACIGRYSSYHTERDTPANLDLGTLQQMGDCGLSVARFALGHEGAFDEGGDAVYFNALGRRFLRYPVGLAPWFGLVPFALRASRLRASGRAWRKSLLAALAVLAILLVVMAIVLAVARMFPEAFSRRAARASDAHLRSVGLGTASMAALAAFLLARVAARLGSAIEAGALVLACAASAAAGLALPAGSFLFTWPALGAALSSLTRGRRALGGVLAFATTAFTASVWGEWIWGLLLALSLPAIWVACGASAWLLLSVLAGQAPFPSEGATRAGR